MNKEKLWNSINEIGNLYMEIELVVGNEPVLFVCTTESYMERYLVMTYDSYEGIFIMRKIDAQTLLDMLKNEVTMESVFRNGSEILETYVNEEDELCIRSYQPSSFPQDKLPCQNEYFELCSKHILDYISELVELKQVN